MPPTYADFSADPPMLSCHATIEQYNCFPGDGQLRLDRGGAVKLTFCVEDLDEYPEATLVINALASRLERHPGYAPMTVIVNGEVIVQDWNIPGGGDLPQPNTFVVPVRCLRNGNNILEVSSKAESNSLLWLYSVFLDPVYKQGESASALRLRTVEVDQPATFSTQQRRVGSDVWESGPSLTFLIQHGGPEAVEFLFWRDREGTETTLTRGWATRDFIGSRRLPDGTLFAYTGRLANDPSPAVVADNHVLAFLTSHDWGKGWYRAGMLSVAINDGSGAAGLTSLGWRDRGGNQALVMLSDDGSRFTGVYHRAGEGPIWYQGSKPN